MSFDESRLSPRSREDAQRAWTTDESDPVILQLLHMEGAEDRTASEDEIRAVYRQDVANGG